MKNAQFSDVFGESSDCFHEYINSIHAGKSSFYPNKKDVWISNSLFHDCTSEENIGAVSCTGSTTVERLFIEETTFTTCKTTKECGG